MSLLRLACSGAATAPPDATSAGGKGPALVWRLSAAFGALLLLLALPSQCSSTVGSSAAFLKTAHQWTAVADPGDCKSLHGSGPVAYVAGSRSTSNDTLFGRCGELCTACHNSPLFCKFTAELTVADPDDYKPPLGCGQVLYDAGCRFMFNGTPFARYSEFWTAFNGTCGFSQFTAELTVADPDVYKPLLGRGPVLYDTGCRFMPDGTPFAPYNQTWLAVNGTCVLGQFVAQLLEADLCACKSLQQQGPVTVDAVSPFSPRIIQFARYVQPWIAFNGVINAQRHSRFVPFYCTAV